MAFGSTAEAPWRSAALGVRRPPALDDWDAQIHIHMLSRAWPSAAQRKRPGAAQRLTEQIASGASAPADPDPLMMIEAEAFVITN